MTLVTESLSQLCNMIEWVVGTVCLSHVVLGDYIHISNNEMHMGRHHLLLLGGRCISDSD